MIKTDHILFIASGAFHVSKPSDLIPELQGRLPIRVELSALTVEDFVRILREPHASLTEQYTALLETEGVRLTFTDDALARNTALMEEITGEHACRAILIGAGLDRPQSSARAWITAHCKLGAEDKSICSEQVAFQLDGKAIGRIRNIVFAHLESDLPLVLWWQGPFSRIFEPRFIGVIDRLIFDSADWADPDKEFTTLLEVTFKPPSRLALHDLAWTRSCQLRSAIAGLFDQPIARPELATIQSAKISHAPGHRTAALFIAAWIASRLGWKPQPSRDPARLCFASDQGTVTIDMEETQKSCAPISTVEIVSENGRFTLSRDPGARYLHASARIAQHESTLLAPADCDRLPDLVSGQLERAGTNRLFREILPIALALQSGS